MTNTIRMFFTEARQTLFESRLESEFYGKIAPHIHKEKDYGYPFDSLKGLAKTGSQCSSDLRSCLAMLDKECQEMPEAYGLAFRYAAYRDLTRRLAVYRKFARRRIYPKTCDPRCIATLA
jgi:hypothetical protein